MKLSQLKPQWISTTNHSGGYMAVDKQEKAQGVEFDCPECGKHRVAQLFSGSLRLHNPHATKWIVDVDKDEVRQQ